MTEEKETFGNFDLTKALELLDLFPYLKWDIPFECLSGRVSETELETRRKAGYSRFE